MGSIHGLSLPPSHGGSCESSFRSSCCSSTHRRRSRARQQPGLRRAPFGTVRTPIPTNNGRQACLAAGCPFKPTRIRTARPRATLGSSSRPRSCRPAPRCGRPRCGCGPRTLRPRRWSSASPTRHPSAWSRRVHGTTRARSIRRAWARRPAWSTANSWVQAPITALGYLKLGAGASTAFRVRARAVRCGMHFGTFTGCCVVPNGSGEEAVERALTGAPATQTR